MGGCATSGQNTLSWSLDQDTSKILEMNRARNRVVLAKPLIKCPVLRQNHPPWRIQINHHFQKNRRADKLGPHIKTTGNSRFLLSFGPHLFTSLCNQENHFPFSLCRLLWSLDGSALAETLLSMCKFRGRSKGMWRGFDLPCSKTSCCNMSYCITKLSYTCSETPIHWSKHLLGAMRLISDWDFDVLLSIHLLAHTKLNKEILRRYWNMREHIRPWGRVQAYHIL